MDKQVNYPALAEALATLTSGIPYEIANLANAAALLWQTLPELNWAGFYRMEDGQLVLGPFQGKPACIVIPLGKGVCGTAAAGAGCAPVSGTHRLRRRIPVRAGDSASPGRCGLGRAGSGQSPGRALHGGGPAGAAPGGGGTGAGSYPLTK